MPTSINPQTHPPLGALPSPIDVRNYKGVCAANVPELEDFPEEFALNKPSTKNQESVAACVAFSLSSVVEYFNSFQENSNIVFSTAYIYGNRLNSTHAGQGMFISQALNNLTKYGDCPVARFKGNFEVPDAIQKFKDYLPVVYADAWPHRISSYFLLDGERTIKASLMQYGPVVISVSWRTGTALETEDGISNILRLHPETKYEGNHCMYIYGWNKTGWLIGNSWGSRWGDNGSCILPYNEKLQEAWGVKDEIYTDRTKDLQIQELKSKITKLQESNLELNSIISKNREEVIRLSNEVTELSVQLFSLQTADLKNKEDLKAAQQQIAEIRQIMDERLLEVERLSAELTRTFEEITAKEKEIEDYKKTIEGLRQQLLEIEKPFHSGIGDFFAKIINFFANLFGKKQK